MRILLIVFIIGASLISEAQVTEVNPNIKWRYIKSQKLELGEGLIYSFESPAEKDFDYRLTVSHNLKSVIAQMHVYDMQLKPIAVFTDSSSSIGSTVQFRVPSDGTFIVVVRIIDKNQPGVTIPTTVTLVRRQAID